MMRKLVLIPIVRLGRQPKGRFLEIISEPTCFGGVNMSALKICGLKKNTIAIEQVLMQLNHQPRSSKLSLTGYLENLSNMQGANLGLLLACFMQEASCPYQRILVTGQLDLTQTHRPVLASEHFETKLQALLQLGEQSESVPFFLPQTMLTEKNNALLSQLASLNIVLKPIDTLSDALGYFGVGLIN